MSLQALLDDGARFDAEYQGGLSNHLPMALLALARLGADDARLAAFAATYAVRLQPAPPAQAWPAGDAWAGRLGERTAWPAYRALFAEWLAHEGDAMLPQVLPVLMPGAGAAAFHGLIRTAYALQGAQAGELADGLAYWACRFMALDGRPPSGEGGIAGRMQRAALEPRFRREAEAATAAVDDATLGRLAGDAARLYAASGNFTVLHLVTGCHALRTLLPCVDEPLALLQAFLPASVAGRIASGAVADTVAETLPWTVLVDAALASDDEHLIKLVDSCREESKVYDGDAWQRAASRAVRDARA